MNEQVISQIGLQERSLPHFGSSDVLRPDFHSGIGATHSYLPGPVLPGSSSRIARGQTRGYKSLHEILYGSFGRKSRLGRGEREPRWHRFVRRYPTLIGLAVLLTPPAAIAQALVMFH